MKTDKKRPWLRGTLCGLGVAVALSVTGCQVDVGGQILPSPFYQSDDVQYSAPGPEAKLPKEAAMMKAYATQQAQQEF